LYFEFRRECSNETRIVWCAFLAALSQASKLAFSVGSLVTSYGTMTRATLSFSGAKRGLVKVLACWSEMPTVALAEADAGIAMASSAVASRDVRKRRRIGMRGAPLSASGTRTGVSARVTSAR
jgi:hypothetical protein